MIGRRSIFAAALALPVLVGLLAIRPQSRTGSSAGPRTDTLPSQLSDEAFWGLVTDFSEPNGYFRSDNFLSNEKAFQRILPTLTATAGSGGAYLGVGPEQNFTYLVALKPKLAFIVDIRRGNLHEHLLYKAFIEMSSDRADFLSRLFARKRPEDLSAAAPIDTMMDAYRAVPADLNVFYENFQAAADWLVKRHGFALSQEDLEGIQYVYNAFYEGGPDLNYSFTNGGGFGGQFPTYAELMAETDDRGEQRSYLATEAAFRALAQMEKNNAIVPLVGNFAGPTALRSVGKYLKEHGATVTAFYTSNVEMYLFQQADDWQKFYANVATLPVDTRSTFIRSVSNRGFQFRIANPVPGARSSTRLSSMADLVGAFERGRIGGYSDVVTMSR
ncbi:MAG: hypothetical protein WBD07_06960 [Vicinamibacterales bacterium]